MRALLLDDEEVLEVAPTRLHAVADHVRVPRDLRARLGVLIAAVLFAGVGVVAARAGNGSAAAARPARTAEPEPRTALVSGPAIAGRGAILLIAEPDGDTIRVLAVDLDRLGGDELRERSPVTLAGVLRGTLLEGPAGRGGHSSSVAVVAYEPDVGGASLTTLWMVRRGARLDRPLVQTRRLIEGYALHPDGSRVAVSLDSVAAQADPALWVYPTSDGAPRRVRSMHRPGAIDPTHHIAPVAWTSEGLLAVPTCLPCRGAFMLDEQGAAVPYEPLAAHRVFAFDTSADGTVGAFQAVAVRRCRGVRAFCDTAPFRLLAGHVGDRLHEIASARSRAFDRIAVSPTGRMIAFTPERTDEVRWRRVSAGPAQRFRIDGAELSPSLWLDDARLVVIERRTAASGAVHSVVHLLTMTERGVTALAVAEGSDLRVLGRLG